MPSLRIPEEYEAGFGILRTLDSAVAERLIEALKEAPATTDPAAVLSAVAPAVEQVKRADLEEVVKVVMSLMTLRATREESAEWVARELCAAMQQSTKESIRLSDDETVKMERLLLELLSISGLRCATRAGTIKTESPRLFRDVRIITEVRPVFDDDVSTLPNGAVIVHSLRIGYYDHRGKTGNFFVSLDDADLGKLRTVVERCENKSLSVRKKLTDSGISEYEG